MKTFKTKDAHGNELILEHHGSFTYYVGTVQFRFLVTREGPFHPLQVTHRISGKKVCEVLPSYFLAALNDKISAGKMAIHKLVQLHGEGKISRALKAAEGATA